VLFPTDTVVGLGCRFDSVEGIARIRKIKGVNEKNPMAVLISNEGQLDALKVRKSRLSNILMRDLWPGGLTIVLSSEEHFPCGGEGNTLGLRMPDVELLRKIIDMIGAPIAATSANFHGRPAAVRISDVDSALKKQADHLIDYEVAPNGLPSTVVTIEGGLLRVGREGAITKEEIFKTAGIEFEQR
jgi:tRNA threonylcarbamoyl adenosine modification protein (Sua5/YciO/YrdC/YwlC family)